MSDHGIQGGEQRSIELRVAELTRYCSGDMLSLEGLQERIEGIPPDAPSSLFHWACRNERLTLEMFECLLDAFPDAARSTNSFTSSPLHAACANKNPDPRIVQLLLDRWPESVNQQDNAGNLPLHNLCCSSSSGAILDLLLAVAPGSVTVEVGDGNLSIHLASWKGRSHQFCKKLIDAYPESLKAESGGFLPIHAACYGGDIETAKYMIELYPESIDARDRNGDLPIHYSTSSKGQHKAGIVRYLLAKDPECASKEDIRGPSLPLHLACEIDCLESVGLLFDAYPEAINIRCGGRGGRAPVEIARAPELRAFLNAQLAYARQAKDITEMATPDENGWLPLHRALRKNAPLGAIKLLVKGNPSALRVAGHNLAFPLHIACESSSVEVVQHLIGRLDIHLHTLNLERNSTLHYACRGGNSGVVKYLLERYVPSVSEPNSDGKLPVHLLWESDRVDRNRLEYVDAVWRLLLAHPETVMH